MKLITNTTELNKAIASIASRGAKLDASIQLAGLSVLNHASEHGDTTLADKLVQAMPKGGRKLALVEWMLAYGQLAKLDKEEDKEAIQAGRIFKLDRSRTLDLESADAKKWFEFKPEGDVATAFDAQAALASVLKRMKAATTKGMAIEHKQEAIEQAQAIIDTLMAEEE